MGTEVVHRVCAGRGGETVLQEAQRERAEYKAMALRGERRAREMDAANGALARDFERSRELRRTLTEDLRYEHGQRRLALEQRDQALREAAAANQALSDLAETPAQQQTAAPHVQPPAAAPESSSFEFDMATRFALLELD